MCRSGASFTRSTPQGTHLVWQQEAAQEREAPAREKSQRPEACRSARVPIEMPRIQNPGTGSRFPPEHSGQKFRQFGKRLSEHAEEGSSFVTSVKANKCGPACRIAEKSVSEEAKKRTSARAGVLDWPPALGRKSAQSRWIHRGWLSGRTRGS